ncbi:MAG: hypothetical protein ACLPX8_02765 [Bryobacteraceae bacterium]|jgi:hypothetical protein
MSKTYAPLVYWSCDFCQVSGELSLPPASYGCDSYDLAVAAHALASELCEGRVRVGNTPPEGTP